MALFNGPNRGVSLPSPEDENKSSFRNVVFFSYLEFRTMDKVHNASDSESRNYTINAMKVSNCCGHVASGGDIISVGGQRQKQGRAVTAQVTPRSTWITHGSSKLLTYRVELRNPLILVRKLVQIKHDRIGRVHKTLEKFIRNFFGGDIKKKGTTWKTQEYMGNYNKMYFKGIVYDYMDRLCGLMVRVPGYTTEMYCASCEVRTEFIYVM
jgi:hypothetical protein